ncbi:DNA-3-methyladenine glycosylase [Candidatus Aerophobetes bacterium]|uniref:Putative 3-methyladenine DNA glycosylase n=1 Tax=Aerophobetes bacterium TaxID=2030807 RepID=A0A523QL86_UNCAE|nr:MAG: DNA-3-methyladenine glycosylase [Candidatus Aerophobetes bacterium]
MLRKIPGSFYARDTRKVARNLLGKILCCKTSEGIAKGRIVETEAYCGDKDPAAHAYRGKTPRSKIMWGRAGVAYVYFVYGMHHMLNVVTEREGSPGSVFIRALEPIEGITLMKQRRKTQDAKSLTNSPAKLTQALGITMQDNGVDLESGHLWIEEGRKEKFDIVSTGRVGIKAGKKLQLRFCIKGDEHVSRI